MAPWFGWYIRLAALQCNVPFENFEETFFCFVSFFTCRALPGANLHISVFHTCAPCPRVALVSSSTKALATLWKNWKGCVFFLFFFSINERIWNFRERLIVFLECPIDFDFPEQIRYSRNSRHVCFNQSFPLQQQQQQKRNKTNQMSLTSGRRQPQWRQGKDSCTECVLAFLPENRKT